MLYLVLKLKQVDTFKMSIYISVVSHGHAELIKELKSIESLVNDFIVVVKSNKPGDNFESFIRCKNFHWLDTNYYSGFGENNNLVFKYCIEQLDMRGSDIFIVLNPDVIIEPSTILTLVNNMIFNKDLIASINLFKDFGFREYDNSIRKFPTLMQFIKSFLRIGNSSVLNKSELSSPCIVDWAAGSFLALFASHYYKLRGFNEKYFMYCEDIDICYRSFKLNAPVKYYPDIKAIHLANHASRSVFSKHFYWHLSSAFRFMLTKAGLTKSKSILNMNVVSVDMIDENKHSNKKNTQTDQNGK